MSTHHIQNYFRHFQPRPITTEEQFWATQQVIDEILDAGELGEDVEDYLNLLGALVHEYEDRTVESRHSRSGDAKGTD